MKNVHILAMKNTKNTLIKRFNRLTCVQRSWYAIVQFLLTIEKMVSNLNDHVDMLNDRVHYGW